LYHESRFRKALNCEGDREAFEDADGHMQKQRYSKQQRSHICQLSARLYVFRNTLENELKPKETLSAFFAGGTLAFLLGVFFYEPSTLLIGASAAIFTLTAVVMLVKPLKFSLIFLMP
jgi:hypothetical protein